MEIHTQLVLAPGALDGTRAPALWTCVGLLALAAIACGVQASRGVPPWTALQSFEVVPLRAAALFTQRTGTFATEPIRQGEVLMLAWSESAPAALSSAMLPLEGGQWALRIHEDLKLGQSRLRALSREGIQRTVTLMDKQIVRIASADGELLPYREFQDASLRRRWRMAACAATSALAAMLLAISSRPLLAALARRAARSQVARPLKSP